MKIKKILQLYRFDTCEQVITIKNKVNEFLKSSWHDNDFKLE